MKKLMMQLAVTGLVLAWATTVFAGSITLRLQAGNCLAQVDNGAHANGYGYVVIKTAKGGGYDVTWQLWNAAPRYSYWAKKPGTLSNPPEFQYLTTNAKGNGSLTVHVDTDPSTWGPWIGLRETSGNLSTCDHPLPPVDQWQGLWAAANPFNPPQ
jgi:hypothetical protein